MVTHLHRLVKKAKEKPSLWHSSNDVLYKFCRKHPYHTDARITVAKILLIGRVCAVAIERRKPEIVEQNDDFYRRRVAPIVMRSAVDRWIEESKTQKPMTPESFEILVEAHARTTELFTKISGLEKRSLASKYLHFHVPWLFFIYDARAIAGMRTVMDVVGRATRYADSRDSQYRSFAEKCVRLTLHCKAEFGVVLQPREL